MGELTLVAILRMQTMFIIRVVAKIYLCAVQYICSYWWTTCSHMGLVVR